MGEVWAAMHHPGPISPESSAQPLDLVALKVLNPDRAEYRDEVLFHDEGRAASVLEHPAIVPTIDRGRHEGRPYIAMELVRGPSLSALLQRLVVARGTLSPTLVAYIGIQVGRALDYAYFQAQHEGRRLRLVHRDVSPHNILLPTEGTGCGVRLTDFGVARTAIQDHRSEVGTVRGKPSYMAPEQVSGGPIDARTDVFALGVVLYECASLRRLFGRKTALKSMEAVLQYRPKPLSDLVPGFPSALSEVVLTALNKKRADRFPSSAALVAALQGCVERRPTGLDPRAEIATHLRRHFESDAFDADARARTGMALARHREARDGLLAELRPPPIAPSHTGGWPSVPVSDPLDPEAIEALRTQLRPQSAGLAPEVFAYATDEQASFHGGAGTSSSGPKVGAPTAVLLLAAALAVSATGLVLARTGSGTPAIVVTTPSLAPPPATTPAVVTEARPAPRSDGTGKHAPPPVSSRGPETPKGRPDAESRPPPTKRLKVKRPKSAPKDATYGEVRALLREVRRRDPAAGGAMLATLVEAGAGNVKKLNELRAEAQIILQRGE